ncbi:bde39f04-722c-45b5-8d82-8ecb0977f8e4 [Sclerotinia trifoliorum]|uniref:Bde39f04-722c-45b5-8d82-8ecb0977f8e4 n=1 Tax=Sclerotinia trifoliorum TaxID=28548 RepID=A0A8H2ZUL6_9HELO|nr:bde39f04-722c-45b5-8d82-8ecb0977f8e4 [Sclerotinia trifoliorum]
MPRLVNYSAKLSVNLRKLKAVRRAIIATAYDLGAVVLKQAISTASKDEYEYAEIFTSIARIVLVGCFQRGDEHQLGMIHLSFLNDTGKDAEWRTLITLVSVQTLVSATRLANTAFLDSKISLRSRIFSLYAGASWRTHTFDYATATIGLSTELAMQEQDHKSGPNDSFPLLAKNIGSSINSCRIADLPAIALEQTILSLVPPNVQMRSTVPLPDHPVLSSTAYQSWSNLNGIQILYLDGPDIEAVTVAAEQIGMDWARRQQESGSYYRPFFQFRFDATDSTSNSMASAVAASVLHFLREAALHSSVYHNILQDQYKLQNAWTDDDLLNLGLCTRPNDCRKKFWARLGEVTSKYEGPVKIVVTANNSEIYTSETFRNELKGWPGMALLVYEASHVVEVEVESENDMQNALIAHLCPIQLGEERIRRTLKRLESMDRKTMASVLHVAETYSRWPIQKSHDNFSLFLEIFENMTPSSTPREVVWGILRSIREQEWLACVLMWMTHGQRPLTEMELASIVSFQIKGQGGSMTPPDDHDVQQCLADIRSRIRGLESLNRGKLCIRPDVLKLMTDEAEECWVRIKNQAPRRTAEFLLEYLKLPSSQERLKVLHENYQKRVQRSGNSITPPMTPDGRKIIFYAVHALPHHLSKIETTGSIKEQMKDLSGPYVQWAKAYWAMSNPFSRPPKGPLRSAWSTWETSDEFELPKLETEHRIDGPVESLIQAVRDNDEGCGTHFRQQNCIGLLERQ